ncbi:HypC/HybG/HupF family hydrogenase formation chaperone [Psychromonas sp. MB-3u-54]|uniref:HypC/HybG/HupF family hydrogenase formation chaperone n=1 Tax=Psychromonas sp. MB-3u-54 TaxID=2058319 RepID=UPI001E3DA158|nr:HypC/HybG/HupF family hydrogenase formation chaperone [Psychromonas sp. MB-3u-54]
MCLAIPGQVISINQSAKPITAKVNFSGIIREVVVEWIDQVAVNDYVIVHAGFAISKLDQQAAFETLQLFDQFDQQQE